MARALVISISAKMASRLKTVTPEEVTELKEAAENLNMRKSTMNWLRDFKTKIASKNKTGDDSS